MTSLKDQVTFSEKKKDCLFTPKPFKTDHCNSCGSHSKLKY